MKAKEKAPNLEPSYINEFPDHLIATNIRLPKGKNHLQAFLKVYPDDKPLLPALETVFEGLSNVHQLGSLLQIEEPVEKELRYLKSQEEIKISQNVQLNLLAPTPIQTELPFGVESYDDWKEKTLTRLKEHFNTEAEAADLSQAFFSQSAGKGIALFNLLAKRYDIVAANPPYMGSKNMGEMIKKYVAKQYVSGKSDLYAAFILRCRELARKGGRVAMVTQQSWMFQNYYANLRNWDEQEFNKRNKDNFRGLLRETCIETLAHLGEHGFHDSSAAGAFVVLFILSNEIANSQHKIKSLRLIGFQNPSEKDLSLKYAISNSNSCISFQRTQYIGPLRSRYEVELNTLENITTGDRTPDQAARILELQNSIEELKTFDQKLNEVAIKGFCPEDNKTLKTRFQQVAIEDATLCLKSQWLRKLEETLQPQITTWKQTAAKTKLNADFPQWIETAFTKLEYLCNSVGEKIPDIKEFTTEPTSTDLAKIICKNPQLMFKQTLKLACNRWWIEFNQTLLVPCKEQIKAYQEENKQLKEEWDNLGTDSTNPRVVEIKNRQATLKKDIKDLKTEVEQINNTGEKVREQIENYEVTEIFTIEQLLAMIEGEKIREQIENHECPEIFLWEQWLSSQPLYDIISSLDGKRNPPQTIAEFITQESAYVPDLNDGVRVNITPLQKAGLLASEVIAKKDIDKAISDRVEWRADERRWCREGKLPQPGWWKI